MTTAPTPIRRLIFLLGFMGCGKTTVGQRLARRLGWSFVDLDAEVERRQGRTIKQIFDEHGEAYFRQAERTVLEAILGRAREEATVVALGGGTVAQPANFDLVRANGGITVWLQCPVEELQRRCRGVSNRPLFQDAVGFRRLYEQRLPYYQQADFCIPADRPDPELVVEDILRCTVF